MAAPQTIAHRAGKIVAAFADPRAAADPELRRMFTEKAAAVLNSSGAMARLHSLGAACLQAWRAHATSQAAFAGELLTSRTPLQLWAAMGHFSQRSIAEAVQSGAACAAALTETVVVGTRPVHRVAVANPKRLARARLKQQRSRG